MSNAGLSGGGDLSGLVPYTGAGILTDATSVAVFDVSNRILYDDAGSQVAGWGAGESYGFHVYGGLQVDNIFNASNSYVDFGSGGDCSILTRALVDGSNFDSVDPKNRQLHNTSGSIVCGWGQVGYAFYATNSAGIYVYLDDGTYAINATGTSSFNDGLNTTYLCNSTYGVDTSGSVNAASYYAGGTPGYTGALNDSTSTQIADVVGGIITAVYF